MGDFSGQQIEPLDSLARNGDAQLPSSPLAALTAGSAGEGRKRGRLSFSLQQKKGKGDMDPVTPVESAEDLPDADLSPSLPDITVTSATPQALLVVAPANGELLQAPRPTHSNRPRDNAPRTADGKPQCPLNIPEESGDYPHINGPRNVKRFGRLPYETHRLHIPLARHWIEHQPVAKYAGAPLFRLCKACPYILVPRILAVRLQLLVETPFILPDEVKQLAAQRGLDVADLEGYDIALLNILGALWND